MINRNFTPDRYWDFQCFCAALVKHVDPVFARARELKSCWTLYRYLVLYGFATKQERLFKYNAGHMVSHEERLHGVYSLHLNLEDECAMTDYVAQLLDIKPVWSVVRKLMWYYRKEQDNLVDEKPYDSIYASGLKVNLTKLEIAPIREVNRLCYPRLNQLDILNNLYSETQTLFYVGSTTALELERIFGQYSGGVLINHLGAYFDDKGVALDGTPSETHRFLHLDEDFRAFQARLLADQRLRKLRLLT